MLTRVSMGMEPGANASNISSLIVSLFVNFYP